MLSKEQPKNNDDTQEQMLSLAGSFTLERTCFVTNK